MARKAGGFRTGETTELRAIAGAIAADNASLSDANYPAVAGVLTGRIDCSGYDTVLIGVEVAVPGTSTMAIEALFFDPDGAVDQKLSRVLLGAPPGITTIGALAAETTGALPGQETQFVELRVFGHPQVFFRVTAVTNSAGTTSSKILGRPGRVRGDRRLNLPFAATP